jgi:hypothetical protein
MTSYSCLDVRHAYAFMTRNDVLLHVLHPCIAVSSLHFLCSVITSNVEYLEAPGWQCKGGLMSWKDTHLPTASP